MQTVYDETQHKPSVMKSKITFLTILLIGLMNQANAQDSVRIIKDILNAPAEFLQDTAEWVGDRVYYCRRVFNANVIGDQEPCKCWTLMKSSNKMPVVHGTLKYIDIFETNSA